MQNVPVATCPAHICQAAATASLILPKEEATDRKKGETEGGEGASEGQLKERSR